MNSTQLANCYRSNNYFTYPEMERLVNEVIANPTKEVQIPDNFLKIPEKGIFFKTLIKIRNLVYSFWKMIVFKVFSARRQSFNNAVNKIVEAYDLKKHSIESVKNLANEHLREKQVLTENLKSLSERKTTHESRLTTKEKEIETQLAAKELILSKAHEYKKANSGFNWFLNQVGFSSPEQKRKELLSLDPEFPLTDLSIDEAIEAYENGKIETPFMRELKKIQNEKTTLEIEGKELDDEITDKIKKLTELKEKAEKLLADMRSSSLLDLCETEEGALLALIESLTIKASDRPSVEEHPPLVSFAEAIEKRTNSKDLASLWKTLLKRFDDGKKIESFTCKDNGKFEIHLSEPLSIWLPSSASDDPIGGVVMLLGELQNKKITGELLNNEIKFSSGVWSYCDTSSLLGIRKTRFDSIKFFNRTKITITGSLGGFSGAKDKCYTPLLKDWKEGGEIIPKEKSYVTYLADKRK